MVGRYILLNNNKIYDLHDTKDVKAYDTVKGSSHDDFKVKKTSNNILNLLEPCTLWDLSGDLFEEHLNDNWVFINKYFSDTDFSNRSKDAKVVAIYKRQSNGDFKKYEVKA